MTPYADMTELQRVQMLADFCGYTWKVMDNGEFQVWGTSIIRTRRYHLDWNPFDNPAALEEVIDRIRSLGCVLELVYCQGSSNGVEATCFNPDNRMATLRRFWNKTKADAIAQVVHTLGERKG